VCAYPAVVNDHAAGGHQVGGVDAGPHTIHLLVPAIAKHRSKVPKSAKKYQKCQTVPKSIKSIKPAVQPACPRKSMATGTQASKRVLIHHCQSTACLFIEQLDMLLWCAVHGLFIHVQLHPIW
jgi:hypothetical protein